jgi:hypothetical protein
MAAVKRVIEGHAPSLVLEKGKKERAKILPSNEVGKWGRLALVSRWLCEEHTL